jgi:hypothetical protein
MSSFYNRLVLAEQKRHSQRSAEIAVMRQMLLAAEYIIHQAEKLLGTQLSVDYYLCGAFCDNQRFALRLTNNLELLDDNLCRALVLLGMTVRRRDHAGEWDSVILEKDEVLITLNVSPNLQVTA